MLTPLLDGMDAAALAALLELAPHPEGGFYRETYRASTLIETPRGPRAASTAIYFLVPRGTFSALHRIASDEVWHHHAGAALRVVQLGEDGVRTDHVLGRDLARGQSPQAVVPAGTWFGATLEHAPEGQGAPGEGAPGQADWSLVGCTVAPGFDFEDFELARREDLLARFPQHAGIVTALTREGA